MGPRAHVGRRRSALDIGLHQSLQRRPRHGSREIAVAALLRQVDKRHFIVDHWILGQLGVG
jgi:uncharacterized protein (DUF2461 family)